MQAFEVVLVDNGSSDGSRGLFDEWMGRKKLVSNLQNQSFSAANNQGVRAASGELVLLANNDIEPIHPDWLGFMVESLATGVAAVGAMLVYPRRRKTNKPSSSSRPDDPAPGYRFPVLQVGRSCCQQWLRTGPTVDC